VKRLYGKLKGVITFVARAVLLTSSSPRRLTQVADVKPLVTAWLCLEVGVDTLITAILSFVLARTLKGFIDLVHYQPTHLSIYSN